MQPPFQLNVGQVPFKKLYQYSVPVIPGFTLLLALLLGRPAWFTQLSTELGLTGFPKVIIFLCASYVCGFILHFISLGIASILSGSIFPFVLNKAAEKWERFYPERQNLEFSKNAEWRRVATLFLGAHLAPTDSRQNQPAGRDNPDLTAEDVAWQEWYNVLQEYIEDRPLIPAKLWATLGALQASGWSLFIASFYVPVLAQWPFRIPEVLAILLGIGIPGLIVYRYPTHDRLGHWFFTAKLLAEVHKREKSTSKLPQEN